jgi:hypothetical protein
MITARQVTAPFYPVVAVGGAGAAVDARIVRRATALT